MADSGIYIITSLWLTNVTCDFRLENVRVKLFFQVPLTCVVTSTKVHDICASYQ